MVCDFFWVKVCMILCLYYSMYVCRCIRLIFQNHHNLRSGTLTWTELLSLLVCPISSITNQTPTSTTIPCEQTLRILLVTSPYKSTLGNKAYSADIMRNCYRGIRISILFS